MKRSFVNKTLRVIILLTVMAISGYIVYHREAGKATKAAPNCANCSKVGTCTLPEAKEFKGEK
jgi:hypothetical protein